MSEKDAATILLVEDDEDLGPVLVSYLELHGFRVQLARDGGTAIARAAERAPDLVVLDIMLPKRDGFEVAAEIRRGSEVPILFLTARSLKVDKLKGFAAGADDYVVKPVDEEVLVARIRALLRRSRTAPATVPTETCRVGRFEFSPSAGALRLGTEVRQLTEREAALLALLVARGGELLSRQEALRSLWGRSDFFSRRSMDVYLHRLRRALRGDPSVRILTVRGRGVRLVIGRSD